MTIQKKFRFKSLCASILLALGISPVVGADEVVENYDIYNQSTFYAPQLTLGGFYGNNGGSYGEADILYPLIQDPLQLFYADIRAQKDNANMWQAAIGLGYRFLTPDAEALYGAYIFYNYENSYLNNTFGQLIGGLEFKTNYIGARVNYYHSIGQTKTYEPTQNGVSFNGIGGINYNMLVANAYEGQIIQGGTAEIGGPIPYVTGLRLFGGYYHFVSNVGQSVIAGPSARMEYRLEEALNLSMPFVERITFEGTWQRDQVNGNLWTVGFRVTLPMGYTNSNTGLQKEMTDYVRFNQVPSSYVSYDTPTINQTNGHNTVFAFVNTETDFDTAIAETPDVMVINENINVIGDQQLPNNVVVTGQYFEYEPGLVANVTNKNVASSITSDESNVFYVGQNNTLQDLQVNQAISNNNNSVGNLIINNITSTNGGVNINVADGGVSSNIAINGSRFTLNAGSAISIQANNNSTVNISSIQNNTVTAGNGLNNLYGIYLFKNDGSIMSFYNVNNNTISIGAGNNNTGIYVENAGLPNTTGSPNGIMNNTINIGSSTGQGNSYGIWINNTGTEIQVVDSISNNALTIGDSGNSSNQFAGINITAGSTSDSADTLQNINFIDNNTITIIPNDSATAQFINGINIYAQSQATQNINNLINNVFNFSGSASGINAISIFTNGDTKINVTNFYNNSTNGAQGEGILVITDGAGHITISTGVNTPYNPSGADALSAANNGMGVDVDPNYDNPTAGTITIEDN